MKEHPSTPLPIWEDFDNFFFDFNGLPAYLAVQLAQMGGEIGEQNLKRLEWWIKMWAVYVYYRSKYADFRRVD